VNKAERERDAGEGKNSDAPRMEYSFSCVLLFRSCGVEQWCFGSMVHLIVAVGRCTWPVKEFSRGSTGGEGVVAREG
jgi:hypothetical protein